MKVIVFLFSHSVGDCTAVDVTVISVLRKQETVYIYTLRNLDSSQSMFSTQTDTNLSLCHFKLQLIAMKYFDYEITVKMLKILNGRLQIRKKRTKTR